MHRHQEHLPRIPAFLLVVMYPRHQSVQHPLQLLLPRRHVPVLQRYHIQLIPVPGNVFPVVGHDGPAQHGGGGTGKDQGAKEEPDAGLETTWGTRLAGFHW